MSIYDHCVQLVNQFVCLLGLPLIASLFRKRPPHVRSGGQNCPGRGIASFRMSAHSNADRSSLALRFAFLWGLHPGHPGNVENDPTET